MRCRRIRRELLWLARFGEFGPSSQPHLDHLAGCRACRDEVGFDRAMVEQLRIALAARIADANPSLAFERILARAQRPEPRPAARLLEWSSALLGRLRFATAMAGTGLALVAALNMDIVQVAQPSTSDAAAAETAALTQVPRIPPPRDSLAAFAREWGTNQSVPARPDPETALTPFGRQPLSVTTPPAELRLVFRANQTPDPVAAPAATASATRGSSSAGAPTQEPGEPS